MAESNENDLMIKNDAKENRIDRVKGILKKKRDSISVLFNKKM